MISSSEYEAGDACAQGGYDVILSGGRSPADRATGEESSGYADAKG
jgi:hypothetical protein